MLGFCLKYEFAKHTQLYWCVCYSAEFSLRAFRHNFMCTEREQSAVERNKVLVKHIDILYSFNFLPFILKKLHKMAPFPPSDKIMKPDLLLLISYFMMEVGPASEIFSLC
jgi:hypothetical protein